MASSKSACLFLVMSLSLANYVRIGSCESNTNTNTNTKQYFLDLTNPLKDLKKEEFEVLIGTTAKVGDPCDPALDKVIATIHSATSTETYLKAIRVLAGKVSRTRTGGGPDTYSEYPVPVPADDATNNGHISPTKSCFGFVLDVSLYRPKLMTCVAGRCQCATKEPLVYVEDPSDPTGCHVVFKKLGESCTFKDKGKGKGKKNGAESPFNSAMNGSGRNDDAYVIAAIALGKNPTVSESGQIMKRFAEDRALEYAAHLIPQDIRNTCYDDDNLMECKPNGKCGCRSLEPYFQYVESNGVCVGKSKSVCYLEAVAKDEETKLIFADGDCADGVKCENAVDTSLVQWPVIKACGGSWGLKDDVSYSSANGRLALVVGGHGHGSYLALLVLGIVMSITISLRPALALALEFVL